MYDFFKGTYGALLGASWRSRKFGMFTDPLFDVMLRRPSARRKVASALARCPPQRVLIVGVEVSGREGDMAKVRQSLTSIVHECHYSFVTMQPKGKFDNVNDAIEKAAKPLDYFDWLLITDDDIALKAGTLDQLIGLMHDMEIVVGQPAHRFRSYTSWTVTKRAWGSLVRQTQYVEIGPLTVLHRRTFEALVPFPATRWCWGLDLYWSDRGQKAGWKFGIVDATPLEHLKPVANSYHDSAAKEEANAFLAARDAYPRREIIMAEGKTLLSWW